MKNGWHEFYGMKVYVEDGKVIRGERNGRTTYPYRKNSRYGGWDNVSGLTVSAFRAGWNRDTIAMM